MTQEELADESWHRARYEEVRRLFPHMPSWDELSDQQRTKVRTANDSFLSKLGQRPHPNEQ